MKNITISLFILVFILTSCKTRMSNPIMNFRLGENEKEWKKKIESNISNGSLSDKYGDDNIYRYYFKRGNEKISSNISFNGGISYGDNYFYGNLRTIVFDLRGDTVNFTGNKEYLRSVGPRDAKTVDKLLSWFVELYGPPTDTIPEDIFGLSSKTEDKMTPEELYKEIYDISPRPGTLIWNEKDYTIEFYRREKFKYGEKNPFAFDSYQDARVVFKIRSLEEALKQITDSIRNKFTPKDVVHITLERPSWTSIHHMNFWDNDREFKINIAQIQRIGREDPRKVTAVQFDVVLTDVFKNEICRLPNLSCVLEKPIIPHKGFIIPSTSFIYTLKYNENSDVGSKLEKAKRLYGMKNLKYHAEINAVEFGDGTVLK